MSTSIKASEPSAQPAARGDALIEVREVGPLGHSQRLLQFLVLGIALVFSAGTAIVDQAFPVELPKLVGRERASDERKREEARFGDGSLARQVERDLQLTSHVRNTVSRVYTLYLYSLFGEADGAQVVVGRDGWIFVKQRALAVNQPTERILAQWATQLVALERAMGCLGIRVTFIPLPRRSAVEFKRLPAGVDSRRDIDREAAGVLRRKGLEAVDLFPSFMAWDGPSLFYHGDAHWNELAERLAAEETLRQVGLLVPEEERRGVLRQVGVETQGTGDDNNRDLYRLAGIDPPAGSELLRGVDVPVFEFVPTGRRALKRLRRGLKRARMSDVALSGTSFSARRKFAMFLEYFSGQPLFDASTMAKGPIEPIRLMLGREDGVRPGWLLAEVPVYTAFQGGATGEDLAELLIEYPAPQAVPLEPVFLDRAAPTIPIGKDTRLTRKPLILVRTAPGSLLSSWDYLFGLRVRGEVLAGEAKLDVVGHKGFGSVRWDVGSHEVCFPLVAPGHAGRALSVRTFSTSKEARFRVDQVEFVTQVDLAARVPLELAGTGEQAGRWYVDFTLEAMLQPRQDRALVVGPWLGSLPRRGQLRVEGIDPATGEVTHKLVDGQIAEGGWVFASLGDLGRRGQAVVRFSVAAGGKRVEILPSVAPVFTAVER